MFKIFDDPFTQLHGAIPNATRPVTVDVEDVTNLDGTELSPVFHARIQNELFTVTAVTVDGGGAGIDRWTMDHLGGAAASAHGVGEPVDVVVTANGLTAGLADYYMANPMTTNGDLITRAAGIAARIPVGTNGQVLTVVSGAPAWAAGLTNPMTTKGDIIIGDTAGASIRLAGSGTNGWVLTYDTATAQPKWAAGGGGGGGTYPPTSYAALVKASGPVAYWKLTEGSGTSFADSSGITNAATGHGTTASGSGGPWTAKVNFDGTDDYMDFALRPIGAGLMPFTLEWWIKPTSGTFVGLIDTSPSAGGTFRQYNTGFFEKQGSGNTIAIASMSNAWHHLAIAVHVYNSGIVHAYVMIDGAVTATADLNAASFAWAAGWIVGNINSGGAGWWSGDMAHFAIYDRALAPAEIKFHFDNATSD